METNDALNKEIEILGSYAVESMLFEVAATPKPGLVDRNNNGAHLDMDYFTFMSSSASLHSSFDKMIRIGIEHSDKPIESLLSYLRNEGKKSEEKMFSFTSGVNTHKGMIFSLGLICGSCGYLLGNNQKLSSENVCLNVKKMCQGISQRDFKNVENKKQLTKGELMYLKYGFKGVRGVVESGFKIVLDISLPIYTKLRDDNVSINDALVHTLLYLIKNIDDTNIASRHDIKTVNYVKEYASLVLDAGGMLTHKGQMMIKKMDDDFIDHYISPGGCADLLAVTHFLYRVNSTY